MLIKILNFSNFSQKSLLGLNFGDHPSHFVQGESTYFDEKGNPPHKTGRGARVAALVAGRPIIIYMVFNTRPGVRPRRFGGLHSGAEPE